MRWRDNSCSPGASCSCARSSESRTRRRRSGDTMQCGSTQRSVCSSRFSADEPTRQALQHSQICSTHIAPRKIRHRILNSGCPTVSNSSIAAQDFMEKKYITPIDYITLFAAQDFMDEGILVSPRLMADHMPDYVTSALSKLARSRRRGNPERGACL